MEKELFQSTLLEKAKAANNNAPIDNLSERTINEVVTMFLPQFADDEKITDDSWSIPVQMIKTISGQLRHDTSTGINDFKTKYEEEQKTAREKAISDAIAAAKAEWEKNNPTTQPQESPKPQEPTDIEKKIAEEIAKLKGEITGESSEIGKLSKQFSDFLTMQAEKDKAIKEADIRSQVRDYLIGRGVEEDDYALEITMEKLVVGDNADVAALSAKAEKDYEAIFKRMHKGDDTRPFLGGGGGNRNSSTDFQEYIKGKQKEAEQEAKAAEELRKHMM